MTAHSEPIVRNQKTMTFTSQALTAKQVIEFFDHVPDEAQVVFEVEKGDPRDPREAGYMAVSIKATWSEK